MKKTNEEVEKTGPLDLKEIHELSEKQSKQQAISHKQERKHNITISEIKTKPIKIGKLIRSFKYAFRGTAYVLRTQPNMRIHFFMGFIALVLGFIFRISSSEWLVLILVIGLVILLEFINTAIETLVDLYTEKYNFLAGITKDVGAATVLVMAIISVVVGCIIFLPRIFKFL